MTDILVLSEYLLGLPVAEKLMLVAGGGSKCKRKQKKYKNQSAQVTGLTLPILRRLVPTPYTKRGGGGGVMISRTLRLRDMKFCRLFGVLFKLTENVK